MPIQAQLNPQSSPAAIIGPLVRVGGQILRAKGLGKSWGLLSELVLPFSVTQTGPLVVLVPIDVAAYAFFHQLVVEPTKEAATFYAKLYREYQAKQNNQDYITLDLDDLLLPSFVDFLERYVIDHAEVGADGQLVYTIPQMWFRDP